MNTKAFFYQTLILSVIVQIVTGAIEVGSLFVKVDTPHFILRDLLFLEIAVQIIEGLFYLWLVFNFNQITNVTPKRYIDWSITTPTMLITFVVYLIYLAQLEKKIDTSNLTLFTVIIENANTLSYILYLNWLMLIFGYLGEANIINKFLGVLLGFIPFLIYYFIIYMKYAVVTEDGIKLFWYFFIFWSLYGIVALLPYYLKNALYNLLDLFAKNFFGLFISYLIIFTPLHNL
jgi:hypothetical protein